MDEIHFSKRPDQVNRHPAKDENIDDRKQQPEGVGRFAADEFAPFRKIDPRDQAFDGGYAGFGKKEV